MLPAKCNVGPQRITGFLRIAMRGGKDSARVRLRIIRTLALLVWLLLLLLPSVARAQESAPPKRVLVLYWYNKDFPWNIQFDQSFQITLQSAPQGTVESYSEYLESNRFPGENQSLLLRDYLKQKYADRTIDVVVATSDASLDFLLKYRDDLFPQAPVVFIGTRHPSKENLATGPGLTGIINLNTHRENLDLALSLHPGTKQVFIISGTLERDKRFETLARKELQGYENKVELVYFTDLSREELFAKAKGLPEDSIVLHVWQQSRNEQGKVLENSEMLATIARSATVPVYAMNFLTLFSLSEDPIDGSGVVGGLITTGGASGTQVAEIALRIANGARAHDIPVEPAPTVPIFDWRELRRWGIDESKLPAGSIVRFKEPTFWEQYKWLIVGVLSLIIFQALLIVWLLVNRARRRQAERENERLAQLAEAERRRLDEVVSNVPGIVWETRFNADGKTRTTHFISDYVEQMLGYSVEDWLSTQNFALTIMAEEDRERVTRATESILESGKEGVLQFRWMAKDGRVLWVEAQIAAIRDETGQPVGLRGVTMDITDRMKAKEALSESEERYRNVVETQTELICRFLPDTTLTFVNDAYCRHFGKTREQLIGTKYTQLIPEHAREAALNHIASLIENPRVEIYEHEVVLPSGGRGWQQWVDNVVGSSNGHGVELQGIGRDITERRQAEEALRSSETRFQTLADSAPLLIWMSGPEKSCTYVNQGWLEFTGRTIEQELGNGWTTGIHREDYAHCLELYSSAFDRKEPFKIEYRLRRADGSFRWMYDSGTPRFSSEGDFLGYIGSCIDISDRKQAEAELQRAHDEVNKLKNQLQEENIYLQEEIKLAHNVDEIIGESDPIKYVLFKIEQVARTESTVLILGETGTGKELVARAIHSQSLRKDRPLVKVNCAALSASLIESELFGHEKGAFTGAAARKMGRFELADGATIFLDEIGELPLDLQPKLLRVIQEGELERLGSSKTLKVDVRIIAATNRNMKSEVEKGTFREDLWYRLNVFPITVPPLRQRKEDISRMVEHFVALFSKKVGKAITSISAATHKKLNDYFWPGNVRELANVIERGVINAQGSVLHIADQFAQSKAADLTDSNQTLEEVEKGHIIQILDQTAWRIEGPSGAAKILGLNPSTLRTRMLKLGIQKSTRSFSAGSETNR
jgi:PAS domain S-box-containing protein